MLMKKRDRSDNTENKVRTGIARRTAIVLACIFAVLIILGGALVGTFFAMRTIGRLSMENRREEKKNDYSYDENVVSFDGKRYRYNDELSVLLFMGVDHITYRSVEALKKAEEEKSTEGMSCASQTDALLLLVIDEKNKKADVIAINRDSMVYLEGYNAAGDSIGSSESQIALAYSYGDGKHKSCEMTAQAVSSFMYDIPIHAYYSMELESIGYITDAIGGVKVTVPVDMTAADESFKEGAEVVLSGKLAEKFLRARAELDDKTNTGRMSRHELFLRAFMVSAFEAVKKDVSLIPNLYNKAARTSYTDITLDEAVYLADLAIKTDISFHSIKGTTDTSGTFDEFRADQNALYKLILDIFYICED